MQIEFGFRKIVGVAAANYHAGSSMDGTVPEHRWRRNRTFKTNTDHAYRVRRWGASSGLLGRNPFPLPDWISVSKNTHRQIVEHAAVQMAPSLEAGAITSAYLILTAVQVCARAAGRLPMPKDAQRNMPSKETHAAGCIPQACRRDKKSTVVPRVCATPTLGRCGVGRPVYLPISSIQRGKAAAQTRLSMACPSRSNHWQFRIAPQLTAGYSGPPARAHPYVEVTLREDTARISWTRVVGLVGGPKGQSRSDAGAPV